MSSPKVFSGQIGSPVCQACKPSFPQRTQGLTHTETGLLVPFLSFGLMPRPSRLDFSFALVPELSPLDMRRDWKGRSF